ncbi:hypothetical protein [Senegalia sp. (in: firmicutes)]|uniref:hypothetical protein n=1 Tax=Senegalia sp. (in: firmicutes) TaxID=1924098 RepID=UPI003F956695
MIDEKKLKHLAIGLIVLANIFFILGLMLPRFRVFVKFPLFKIYFWIFILSLLVIFIRNIKIRNKMKDN